MPRDSRSSCRRQSLRRYRLVSIASKVILNRRNLTFFCFLYFPVRCQVLTSVITLARSVKCVIIRGHDDVAEKNVEFVLSLLLVFLNYIMLTIWFENSSSISVAISIGGKSIKNLFCFQSSKMKTLTRCNE